MEQNNKFSIIALVCGILGIIGAWIPIVCYFTFVLSILGIVFGAKGMKMAQANGGQGKGLAVAGLVCGIVGAVVGLIGILCVACAAATVGCAGLNAGLFS